MMKSKYFGAKLFNRIFNAVRTMQDFKFNLPNFLCTKINTICLPIVFNFGE
jgi:hypothetical protein